MTWNQYQNDFLGIHRIHKLTLEFLKANEGWLVVAGANNTYILCPLSVAFPEVRINEECLKTIRLALHYQTMKCYIASDYRDKEYHTTV